MEPGEPRKFRVFRSAKPLKDPTTGEVLGYEAQFVGKARLARGEAMREVVTKDGQTGLEIEPATIDIVTTKEEIRAGDRMLVDVAMENVAFAPHAPVDAQAGQIVSVYGMPCASQRRTRWWSSTGGKPRAWRWGMCWPF